MVRKKGKKKLKNKSSPIQHGVVQKASGTQNEVPTTVITNPSSQIKRKKKIKSKKSSYKLKADSDSAVYFGIVKWYNYLKNFGFITGISNFNHVVRM